MKSWWSEGGRDDCGCAVTLEVFIVSQIAHVGRSRRNSKYGDKRCLWGQVNETFVTIFFSCWILDLTGVFNQSEYWFKILFLLVLYLKCETNVIFFKLKGNWYVAWNWNRMRDLDAVLNLSFTYGIYIALSSLKWIIIFILFFVKKMLNLDHLRKETAKTSLL